MEERKVNPQKHLSLLENAESDLTAIPMLTDPSHNIRNKGAVIDGNDAGTCCISAHNIATK